MHFFVRQAWQQLKSEHLNDYNIKNTMYLDELTNDYIDKESHKFY